MTQEILLFTNDEAAAASAVSASGGRLLHVFTPRVFVAGLPMGVDRGQLPSVSTVAPADLDPLSRIFVDAWQKHTLENGVRAALQPRKWHASDFQPPGRYHAPEGGPQPPTSLYLTNTVA